MRKSRFSVEQIVAALKQAELGMPTAAPIARCNGVLATIPNPTVLLSPLTSQQAALSSSIEGTHATMSEVLSLAAGADELLPLERRGDIHEVLDYRRAMNDVQRLRAELPLSQRGLCGAHRVLMEGVRGGDKAPRKFRRVPVSIEPERHDPSRVRFLPVSAGDLTVSMGECPPGQRQAGVLPGREGRGPA